MKLYSHPVSPFARKARVIAHELGLKLEIVISTAPARMQNLRQLNPLSRFRRWCWMMVRSLFDSPVICEYLNHTGGGKFFPGMNIWQPQ